MSFLSVLVNTSLLMKKPSLEADIKSCSIITEKIRSSDLYAQHLYAALCNNTFQKQELSSVLRNESWCCSWRYAGGIIADVKESGDYLDWYCSGMFDTPEYAKEGEITPEVRMDLKNIGWIAEETD